MIKYFLKSRWFAPSVLIFAVLALYGRGLGYPFVFDSPALLNAGLGGFHEGFSFFEDRWVTLLTFEATYLIFGLSSVAFKLGNVLLHAANVILLWRIARKILTGDRRLATDDQLNVNAPRIVFVGALIFAVNPVVVYAVIYDVQRNSLLAAFFCLLATEIYWRVRAKPTLLNQAGVVLCFYLGVFSKELVVTYPLFLAVLHFMFKNGVRPRHETTSETCLMSRSDPIFISLWVGLGLVMLVVLFKYAGILGTAYEPLVGQILDSTSANGIQASAPSGLNLWFASAMQQTALFFDYVFLWLVPVVTRLSVDVAVSFSELPLSPVLLLGFAAFVILVVIILNVVSSRSRHLELGFAFSWTLILFLPELAVVRAHEPFVLYRAYLWLMPLGFVVAAVVFKFAGRAAKAILMAYILILFVAANERVTSFSSPLILWRDAAAKIHGDQETLKRTSAYRTYANLAGFEAGGGDFKTAHKLYEKALDLNPSYGSAHVGLGVMLLAQNRLDEALAALQKAVVLDPKSPTAYNALGNVQKAMGDFTAALKSYETALALNPRYDMAAYNLGLLWHETGGTAQALKFLSQAVTLNPKNSRAYYALGNVHFGQSDLVAAQQAYTNAVAVDPDYVDARYNLGIVFLKADRKDKAREEFERVLQIKPDFQKAKEALEWMAKASR